jgi:hypothetical protein
VIRSTACGDALAGPARLPPPDSQRGHRPSHMHAGRPQPPPARPPQPRGRPKRCAHRPGSATEPERVILRALAWASRPPWAPTHHAEPALGRRAHRRWCYKNLPPGSRSPSASLSSLESRHSSYAASSVCLVGLALSCFIAGPSPRPRALCPIVSSRLPLLLAALSRLTAAQYQC